MLQRKENVDKNLDPDAEWLLICHMCSNTRMKLLSSSFFQGITRFICLIIKKIMGILDNA